MSKTLSHYQDYFDVRGDGRIVLYKRADHQKPKWTVRLRIPLTKDFVVKSCKTIDRFEARKFAEQLYYELEGRVRRGEPIHSPTFKAAFEAWANAVKAETRIRSSKYINGNIRRVELWPLRFLGDHMMDLINDSTMADYSEWRLIQTPKPPKAATLRNERNALNQLFRFARRKGYMRQIPQIEVRASKNTARPDIPEVEWRRLCDFLTMYVANAVDRRRLRERFYLRHYILVLGNTGIRVGEARRLRWRDISSTRTLSGEARPVLTVRGKTGEREVVCNEGVDYFLNEMFEYRSTELAQPPNSNEYVFCRKDGAAVGSFKKGFERALREADLLTATDGKRRVPYSLRHTYATMRISEGVNVFQLAANMGTSVEMIENFYGKKRVRDPKMASEITKKSSSAPNRQIVTDEGSCPLPLSSGS